MRKLLSIMVILLLCLALTGCGANSGDTKKVTTTQKTTKTTSSNKEIKFGFIGPLTGDAATLGQASKESAQMAIDEINAAGGIKGRKIRLVPEDGTCNAEGATNAANKLVNVDNVPVIIGGECSAETLAAAPIAEGKTVMVSPCSSNPDVTDAGDYIFRTYPSDSFAGKFAAEYAYNKMGARKVSELYCLSDWCVGLKEVFAKRFKELGGEILNEHAFEQSSRDLRSQLTKIKDEDPDLVYFTSYTESAIVGFKQAKELGLDMPIIGGDAWDDPTIPEQAGENANGHMYTMLKIDVPTDFQQKMDAEGHGDIPVCSPQAYDVVYILKKAIEDARSTNPEKIKEALYKMEPYSGVSGTIEFDHNGDIVGSEYDMKVFMDGKVLVKR